MSVESHGLRPLALSIASTAFLLNLDYLSPEVEHFRIMEPETHSDPTELGRGSANA